MSTHFPDDDPLATRLHDALDSEAAMVTPSDDGLQRIRAGIDVAHRPWWRHPAAIAVAAAVVLGTAVGIGAAVLGGGDGGTVVATDTTTGGGTPSDATSTPAATTASVQPEPQDPPMTGTPRPAGDTVYVYYVHNDGQGPRLYREQHSEMTAGNTPNSGLMSLFSSPPKDPDYKSLWPSENPIDYAVDGNIATVNLSAWPALGSQFESIAVQELVYTVTANDPSVKSVKLLVNGKTPPSGHLDLSKPISRALMMDVQGWIWLLSPTEGATVSSPVTISGYGTAFEGTISWEVRKMDKAVATDQKVAEGHTQGGSNGEFGDFSDTVDLPPGTYEIRAFESSPKDGSPQHVDTKTFTVQ
jgi:hypothetical protein